VDWINLAVKCLVQKWAGRTLTGWVWL